jgi:nucleotide-binding universal stress UspA family protein
MLSRPNILVCSDFSPFSDQAIIAADKLANKTGGNLLVLHVSEVVLMWDWLPRDSSFLDEKYTTEIIKKQKEKLQVQLTKCGVKAEMEVKTGVPSQVINEEIFHRNTDLLVLGHKGKTGGHFHLGGTAEKMIASSSVPVLIVKQKFLTNKIAALIDPNGPMERILNTAEELSSLFSSAFEVISLFPDILGRYLGAGRLGVSSKLFNLSEDQKKEIITETTSTIKNLIDTHVKTHIRVEISNERKIAYHLNSILNEDRVNLVIMQRHNADFLEKILIGSETRRLLEIFEGNFYILPPSNQPISDDLK